MADCKSVTREDAELLIEICELLQMVAGRFSNAGRLMGMIASRDVEKYQDDLPENVSNGISSMLAFGCGLSLDALTEIAQNQDLIGCDDDDDDDAMMSRIDAALRKRKEALERWYPETKQQ